MSKSYLSIFIALWIFISIFATFTKGERSELISTTIKPDSDSGNDETTDYQPSKRLRKPIVTYYRMLINGGPTNPYAVSQLGLSKNQMGMYEKSSVEIMEDIKEGLRYVFQTRNKWTFPLTGSGHVAIDAILDNLLEPGDVILVPVCGMWGERIVEFSSRLGAIPKNITKSPGETFSLKEIEDAIIEFKPNVVFIINGESSTGVVQKLEGIGDLCRKYDCLLIVDTVATIGVIPFYFDAWKIDAAYCNNHKGIAAPVGLAPISLGPRALAKIANRKTKPRSYRTDFKVMSEANYWNINGTWGYQNYHHSFPILLYYSLREALTIISAETLENVWKRHEDSTKRLYAGLEEFKLEYFVKDPADRLRGTVMINPPPGLLPVDLQNYLRDKHSIELGTGLGPTAGKKIRIALLGPNANVANTETILDALKDALIHFQVINTAETIRSTTALPPLLGALVPGLK